VPFVLGAVAALFLFPQYAGPRATFPAFTLFMAISLSITAFPVLVRMLQERRMMKSDLGSAALASAAIDDASAWTMLSLIIAFVTARGLEAAAVKLGALAVFVAATMLVVRPAMARWLPTRETTGEHFGDSVMAVVLLYMTLSALTTELLGVHALFGAFLAGVCMPRGNQFCEHLASRLAGFNRVLLLPLFFALSGARTQLGLLDGRGWCICGFITLLATIGKLGGCMTAARLGGMKWRQAFAFGALMNTRGLMELVVINLGYDLGILSPAIFSVLVVMAIVTTLLTGPLLALSERRAGKPWEGSPMPAYSRS
jgi:Kef-type K+ transport system membrane component KefB